MVVDSSPPDIPAMVEKTMMLGADADADGKKDEMKLPVCVSDASSGEGTGTGTGNGTGNAQDNLEAVASQASAAPVLTLSKVRAIALVATVTGASFLNVRTILDPTHSH